MEEYPECPICSDIFGINKDHIKAPKILSCGDSICKECLEDLLKNTDENYFICQVCNEKIEKKNIDNYVTNKDLIKVVNSCFNIPVKENEEQEGDKTITYNIVLLGNYGVGKSSIFNRLSKDIFSENIPSTVGLDSTIYFIKFRNKRYKLIIRDTSGQEKYKAITQSFLRQTDGVFFIYDISNQDTFDDLEFWYDLYKKENENVIGILIGNKCECIHEVTEDKAKKFVGDHGLKNYFETSAKLDKNLKKALACLLEEIIESKALYNSLRSVDVNFSLKPEKKEEKSGKKKKCSC